MKRFYNLFRWLNLLLILVTFLAYLSPYINPENFSWINILGTAYPWFLLFNILFVAFWGIARQKYFLFSLCCIIMGWNHFTNFFGLSLSSAVRSEQAVNIVTFNTSGLGFLAAKDTNQHKQNVQDFIKTLNADQKTDIFCVQEVTSHKAQQAVEKFKFKYEHRIQYRGTAILSNFPILKTGEVSFGTRANSCVWADIKIRDKTIRVYNVHLKSNQVSTEAEKLLNEGDIQERETWSNIKGMFGKFRYTSIIRVEQARKVRAHIAQSPHPVVLCGDFNETPQSYVYAMLSENYCDSFREKGFGLGTTYSGSIPALRIDYILVDPRLSVIDCKLLKEDFSDHYPVVATIETQW